MKGSAPCLTALGALPACVLCPGAMLVLGTPRAPFQGVVVGRLMGEKVPRTWLVQILKESLHLWGAPHLGWQCVEEQVPESRAPCLPG